MKILYKDAYTASAAQQNVASIAFAGTVLGQLVFGYTSDHWSRRHSLLISTIILIVFAALGAGSYGAGGNIQGTFAALTAFRFLLGIGIGGEYPAGSVACAESTGELKEGHRNRWFIFFTNFMIDSGFWVATLCAMIVTLACGDNHLRAAWRICLGLAVIPPLSLLYLRIKLKEPESFSRNKMNSYPWWLVLRFYGFRLCIVSLIWSVTSRIVRPWYTLYLTENRFIYDFSSYSFTIYSSSWLVFLLPADAPLWKSFGWSTVINLFYIPGAGLGAFVSDWLGPKRALALGVILQGAVGFLMSGIYEHLDHPGQVGGFVVIFGIFLSSRRTGTRRQHRSCRVQDVSHMYPRTVLWHSCCRRQNRCFRWHLCLPRHHRCGGR